LANVCPPPGLLRRAVGAGGVYDDHLKLVAGVVLSVYVLQLLLDVPGLVVSGYGDCNRGRVLKVSPHVPRPLQPSLGLHVIRQRHAEVDRGESRGNGEGVHGVSGALLRMAGAGSPYLYRYHESRDRAAGLLRRSALGGVLYNR